MVERNYASADQIRAYLKNGQPEAPSDSVVQTRLTPPVPTNSARIIIVHDLKNNIRVPREEYMAFTSRNNLVPDNGDALHPSPLDR